MRRQSVSIRRNYLRVRGEYINERSIRELWWELPPRARRIPLKFGVFDPAVGTTSACAENTSQLGTGDLNFRNYLRVRGEYG